MSNLYTEKRGYDSPKHRIQEAGPASLTTAELLAVALRINSIDTAEELAKEYERAGALGRISQESVLKIKGLGEGYFLAMKAISEITRREVTPTTDDRAQIHSPQSIFDLVGYEMGVLEHEEMWIILLNQRNRVKKIVKLYKGTVNSSPVRVAEVFRDAIRENAPSIVLVHNHPSGDPVPSAEDVHLTRAAVSAGKTLDIEVLDHVVIGANQFASLKEKGLL